MSIVQEIKDAWIDVYFPYELGRKLTTACNRIMENTKAPWTLILDHDVYLCNPFWYEICLSAVKKVGYKAGWITCVTNRIGAPNQRVEGVLETDDLSYHLSLGAKLWKKYGVKVNEVQGKLSGFFILTHREAWKAVGGFRPSRKTWDWAPDHFYHIDIVNAGYKLYVMPGLYTFHYWKVTRGSNGRLDRENLRKVNLEELYGREGFSK